MENSAVRLDRGCAIEKKRWDAMEGVCWLWGISWWWLGRPLNHVCGRGGGVLGQKSETAPCGSIAVAPLGNAVGGDGQGGWVTEGEVVMMARAINQPHRQGEGLGAEYPKLSRRGSVSVLLCQTAREGGKGRWLGGLYEATAVARRCVCKREAQGGGEG